MAVLIAVGPAACGRSSSETQGPVGGGGGDSAVGGGGGGTDTDGSAPGDASGTGADGSTDARAGDAASDATAGADADALLEPPDLGPCVAARCPKPNGADGPLVPCCTTSGECGFDYDGVCAPSPPYDGAMGDGPPRPDSGDATPSPDVELPD